MFRNPVFSLASAGLFCKKSFPAKQVVCSWCWQGLERSINPKFVASFSHERHRSWADKGNNIQTEVLSSTADLRQKRRCLSDCWDPKSLWCFHTDNNRKVVQKLIFPQLLVQRSHLEIYHAFSSLFTFTYEWKLEKCGSYCIYIYLEWDKFQVSVFAIDCGFF